MHLFLKSLLEYDSTNPKKMTTEEKKTKDQTQGRSEGEITEERRADPDATGEEQRPKKGTLTAVSGQAPAKHRIMEGRWPKFRS